MNTEAKTKLVQIVDLKTGRIETTMGPFTPQRADTIADGANINLNHLQFRVEIIDKPIETLAEATRRVIVEALTVHEGNVSKACLAAGIPRATFYREVKRLGIDSTSFRPKRER